MLKTESLNIDYVERSLSFPDIDMSNTNQLLIIGQSGSGKTSLLNAIGGLQKPSAGKVWINETDIYQLSSKKLDFFRGRNIGFVFQQPHFITSLDVESNLKFAMTVEPHNEEILNALKEVQESRSINKPSLPSRIETELKINPFMRCRESTVIEAAEKYSKRKLGNTAEILGEIRNWKDNF